MIEDPTSPRPLLRRSGPAPHRPRTRWSLRRRLSGAVVALLLAVPLVTVAGPAAPAASAAARPNVLTIMLDDANLDYDEVNWREAMPRSAQFFADGGREYTRAHSVIPSCCPSRATFFTGTYTQNNGVAGQSEGADMDPAGVLQAYLGRAGYRTMLAGKFLNVWTAPPLGFHDYTSIVRVNAYDDYTIIERGVERPGTAFLTTFTGQRARAMLRATEADDARPWHLNLSLNAPHMHGAMEDPDHPPVPIPGRCHYPRETDRTDKPPFVRAVDVSSAAANWVCSRSLQALYGADRQIGETLDEVRRLGQRQHARRPHQRQRHPGRLAEPGPQVGGVRPVRAGAAAAQGAGRPRRQGQPPGRADRRAADGAGPAGDPCPHGPPAARRRLAAEHVPTAVPAAAVPPGPAHRPGGPGRRPGTP